MTPKEINDLKIKFNAMQEDGRIKYEEVLKISESMKVITDTLIEVEGDDYDDTALLRMALEGYESMYGRKPEHIEKIITALRERLGEKA